MPTIQTMFVVLSDLHFGRDLYDPPELPLINFSPVVKWLNKEESVSRYFEQKCLGHSIACVKKLPRYLQYLFRAAQDEGYEGNSFDLFILLGDQATIPDGQTYQFLRGYLTQDKYETHDADGGFYCAGLGLRPEQILAIPGNHDKLLRRDLDLYNFEFTTKLGLQDQVAPRGCTVVTREYRNREFVFVLLDASNYAAQELTLDSTSPGHLASGKLTKELYQQMGDKLRTLKEGRKVDHAQLRGSYMEATKILLVHYAVSLRKVIGVVRPSETVVPHDCEGLGESVAKLLTEFQIGMVLHGHLHSPALYNHDGVQVIAATTTTQQDAKNGFFLLKVFDNGELRAEHHVWNGAAFAADPAGSLNKLLVHAVAA